MDDCGKLTIRCSQDYFSLDCGITAFELSDYSPGEEPESQIADPNGGDTTQEPDQTQGSNREPGAEESERSCLSNHELRNSLPEFTAPVDPTDHSPSILPTAQCGVSNQSESAKRPLQGVSHSTEVSPTQPSLPKRAALFSDSGSREEDSGGGLRKVSRVFGLQHQAELSRSTPSLMDPPDRTKFWLELDSVYPENVSQSYESLQVCLSVLHSFIFLMSMKPLKMINSIRIDQLVFLGVLFLPFASIVSCDVNMFVACMRPCSKSSLVLF